MTSGPTVLIEGPAFGKQLDRLRPELQLLTKLAITEILTKEGLSLASSSWLRFVGTGFGNFESVEV